MKQFRLGLLVVVLLVVFTLTGCSSSDPDGYKFIEDCNRKSGCSYKVLSNECVCDKIHDYIQGS